MARFSPPLHFQHLAQSQQRSWILQRTVVAISNEGKSFWAIENGSPDTAMIGHGPVLSDDEIVSLIQYERTFAGRHGQGRMGHGKGMGP